MYAVVCGMLCIRWGFQLLPVEQWGETAAVKASWLRAVESRESASFQSKLATVLYIHGNSAWLNVQQEGWICLQEVCSYLVS